jgi:cell division transport system permease protein
MTRPLIPADRASDLPLFAAVVILVLLACLAGLAARTATVATDRWTGDLARSMTVQILAPDDAESLARATSFIAGLDGVDSAKAMTRERAATLLKPWLGDGELPSDLPLPRLIEVSLEAPAPALTNKILAVMAAEGIVAKVDDHSRWAGEVGQTAMTIRTGAMAAMILLGIAAALTAGFATRASLAARRDVVDTLHLLGADDSRISLIFAGRYFTTGLLSGAIGSVAAFSAALALRNQLTAEPGVIAGAFDWSGLMVLDIYGVAILVGAPIVAGLITMFAAQASVTSALNRYKRAQ